ncbi:MAG: hypothetical protein GAK37_01560 [Pseudomonas sp.]|nr:MAG: hypothetical protein GAK37_01560 [Pseudomonas sp.]
MWGSKVRGRRGGLGKEKGHGRGHDHRGRERQERGTHLEGDGRARLDHHVHAALDVGVHAGGDPGLHATVDDHVGARRQRHVTRGFLVAVAAHRRMPVAADVLAQVLVDLGMAVATHPVQRVLEHALVEVFLGMQKHLLRALLVFKAQLVVATAALGRVAFDGRACGVFRQWVRWQGVGVVDAAGDQRLVGIAFQEAHDHFLADARGEQAAPAFACPALRHANPARAVFVALAFAVPVELHLDAPVLVGPYLFALLAHHHGCLWTVHQRFGRGDRRAKLLLARQGHEFTGEHRRRMGRRRGLVGVGGQRIPRLQQQELRVLLAARVLRERHQRAGKQAPCTGGAGHSLGAGVQRLDQGARGVFARLALGIAARIVIALVARLRVAARQAGLGQQVGRRLFKVEVLQHLAARLHLTAHAPVVDHLALAHGVVLRRQVAQLRIARRR